MEYRLGKCSACGAEYKVPASFAHDVARCKVCKGIVRLGPARGAARAATPSAESATASAPPGPLPERPAARSAPMPKPELRSPARDTSSPPAGALRDAPAPRPGARRADEPGERTPAKSVGGGHARPKPKKAPLGGLLALGALLLIAAGAFFLFGGERESGGAPQEPAPEARAPSSATEAPPGEGPEVLQAPAPKAAEEDRAPSAETPERGVKKASEAPRVDLAALPDFGPAQGCSPEEWQELERSVATFMDLDAGAAGMRAGRALEEQGRIAVPAILNHMKTLDFSTSEGLRKGDMCQKTLERISYGRNYGWKYEGTEGAADYDERVVEKWASTWIQCSEDIEAWILFTNLEEKAPEEAQRLRQEFGAAGAAAGSAAEDLDVD